MVFEEWRMGIRGARAETVEINGRSRKDKTMKKKEQIPDRRAATEGERFIYENREYTVAGKTEGNNGSWVCISCGLRLDNNLHKDIHCGRPRPRNSEQKPGGKNASGERARHVLAWFSNISGLFEVP
jgi:hypothetical protein